MVDKADIDSLEEFFSVPKIPEPSFSIDYGVSPTPTYIIDSSHDLITALSKTKTVSATIEAEIGTYSRCTIELVGHQEDLITIIDILRRGRF